ncbi:hypothetical protein ANCCEY_15081, partial [Ancylostoma ceylanicum]
GSELFSGGNDGVVVRHDVVTHKPLSVHEERHPVYSISANPIDVNVVAASRESGVVAFYDRRESKEGSFCLIDEGQLFRGQYNPANALFFATASNRGIRLYDLRNRKKALLDLRTLVKEAIYVEWNSTGTALAALQSHSDPTYIDVWSSLPIPYSYDKPRIRVKKTYLSELSFDEGLVADDTAEDLNMLNYFDQLDN